MSIKVRTGSETYELPKAIGYLSAAPRVSTRMNSEAGGPRSHILGIISAFKTLGWSVYPYIVGDKIPEDLQRSSRKVLESSFLVRIISDIVRMLLGLLHSFLAWRELHTKTDWVYERSAVFQALGWILQTKKRLWIIETSALYYYEASVERKSIAFKGIARLIEKWVYKKCDVLVCVSDQLKQTIIKDLNIQPEKIIVVPNGVDCARFNPEGLKPIRLFKSTTIGFVSALVKWHHLEILLEAIAELKRQGIEFNLAVIGDGPMRLPWQQLANELGLSQNTSFPGQIAWDKIPAYIAGFDLGYIGNDVMDIGVMYHSPLKLYEYMAMAIPVVSTEFPDSVNIVSYGKNGYLFPAGDVGKLTRTLIDAYEHRDRWLEMGKNARIAVLNKASWVSRVERMIIEIESLQG